MPRFDAAPLPRFGFDDTCVAFPHTHVPRSWWVLLAMDPPATVPGLKCMRLAISAMAEMPGAIFIVWAREALNAGRHCQVLAPQHCFQANLAREISAPRSLRSPGRCRVRAARNPTSNTWVAPPVSCLRSWTLTTSASPRFTVRAVTQPSDRGGKILRSLASSSNARAIRGQARCRRVLAGDPIWI